MGPAAGKARGRQRTRSGDPGRARREEEELKGERSARRESRRKWCGPSAQSSGGEQLGPRDPCRAEARGPGVTVPRPRSCRRPGAAAVPGLPAAAGWGGGGTAAGRWQLEEEPRGCPVRPGGGRAVPAEPRWDDPLTAAMQP